MNCREISRFLTSFRILWPMRISQDFEWLGKKIRGYTIFLPDNRENIQKLPFCRGLIVCASFLFVNVETVRSFDFSCYFPIHGKKASTSTLPLHRAVSSSTKYRANNAFRALRFHFAFKSGCFLHFAWKIGSTLHFWALRCFAVKSCHSPQFA